MDCGLQIPEALELLLQLLFQLRNGLALVFHQTGQLTGRCGAPFLGLAQRLLGPVVFRGCRPGGGRRFPGIDESLQSLAHDGLVEFALAHLIAQ